jgi:cobalt-zinc-cadmium efflux system outer membrane protein
MNAFQAAGVAVAVVVAAAAPSAAQTPPASASPASAQVRLTLADAVARARTGNRAIAAARLKQAIDAAGIDVAAERQNPEFAYELDRDFPHQAFSLTFPFETGAKRARRIDLAKATVGVTQATIAQTAADVMADIRRAYFTLAAAETRAAILSELRDLAKRAADTAAARVAVGDVPRLEQLQAEL